jgi:hypothetical protein
MALISKLVKESTTTISVKLESGLVGKLKRYVEYTGGDTTQAYIISESLKFIFARDKGFQEWLSSVSTDTPVKSRKAVAE